jgi:hypothetical protein
MQAGFPFKRQITTRPSSINFGGDGRYLFVLCQMADTVVVKDLIGDVGVISPKTLADNNRVATIALGGASYSSFNIVYRSVALEVWVFKLNSCVVIDADPLSLNFCEIKQTLTQSQISLANTTVIYQPEGDFFVLNNRVYNPVSNTIVSVPNPGVVPSAYFALLNSRVYACAAIQGWNFGVFSMDTNLPAPPYHFNGNGGEALKIGSKYYVQNLRISEEGVREALLSFNAALFHSTYDMNTKTIVGGNNMFLNLITVNPYFYKANLQTNVADQIGGTAIQVKSLIYSPFTQKVYVKHGNYNAPAGLNRIIVIDTSRSTNADMVCGYHVVDEHATNALYAPSTTMCINYVRNSEYAE